MRRLTLASEDLLALAEEVLGQGGSLSFDATGSSMWPFLRAGDALLVEPVSAGDVSIGDVVVYRARGRLVAHRVVGRRERRRPQWLICPDAAPGAWEHVADTDLLGRVVSCRRGTRKRSLDRGAWWVLGLLWAKSYPMNRILVFGVRSVRGAARLLRVVPGGRS